MADLWVVQRHGKQSTPMPTARLKRLAATGKLWPTDLVQEEGGKFIPASRPAGALSAIDRGSTRSSATGPSRRKTIRREILKQDRQPSRPAWRGSLGRSWIRRDDRDRTGRIRRRARVRESIRRCCRQRRNSLRRSDGHERERSRAAAGTKGGGPGAVASTKGGRAPAVESTKSGATRGRGEHERGAS